MICLGIVIENSLLLFRIKNNFKNLKNMIKFYIKIVFEFFFLQMIGYFL